MASWNKVTESLIWRITGKLRAQRNGLFLKRMCPTCDTTVLDLGSEDGSQIASFYPYPHRVTIADIKEEPLRKGVAQYGFAGYVVLPRHGPLPIADQAFDVVYCNSVIEHVTASRFLDQTTFVRLAQRNQRRFADEIRRVGRRYFVQTPNRHFPIEAHSLLPFTGYLSARRNAQLAHLLKRIWIKQWSGGSWLLTREKMIELFPGARIIPERFFGLTKSWIAVG